MLQKLKTITILLLGISFSAFGQNKYAVYLDESKPISERVNILIEGSKS